MSLQVAQTILEQLGGRRFLAMVGAKNIAGDESSVQFSIGNGAKNKINKVRVKLEDSDTYTVEFWSIRGAKFDLVSTFSDVYCDQLQEIFTAETGFYCTL